MAYPPNVINEYVWFEFFRQNDKKRETISIRAWDYPNKRLRVQAKAMLAVLVPFSRQILGVLGTKHVACADISISCTAALLK